MAITYHYMRSTKDGEGPEIGKEPKNGVELDNGEEREFFEQAIQNIRTTYFQAAEQKGQIAE